MRYAGATSRGAPVGATCDFQRAARAACAGDELHDHESLVLNQDDLERVRAVPRDAERYLLGLALPGGERRHPCWKDLPEHGTTSSKGKDGKLKPLIPDYARSYRRPNACFGRLAWSDIVPTVVCRPEPQP